MMRTAVFPTWARKCALMLVALAAFSASAAEWPEKTVTVVVPFPPGGPSDIVARPITTRLAEVFGKPFIIDNRGGAGGNIGTDLVAKSAPDGHTLLISSSAPIVINPSLYKKLAFDPAKDLAPITMLAKVPLVLAAHPSVPAKDLQELVALIKSKDGNFQYASSGSGTPQHMTGELFKTTAKLDMIHVPYKGSAPAITDLMGGHVPVMFDSLIAILPHIKAGKVKAIAVTSAQRSPQLPDVPTFIEAGYPGFEAYAWYGFFTRAGTPPAVIDRINAETLKIMKTPEFSQRLEEMGSAFVGDTPDNFRAFITSETAKWAKVVKESGATVD